MWDAAQTSAFSGGGGGGTITTLPKLWDGITCTEGPIIITLDILQSWVYRSPDGWLMPPIWRSNTVLPATFSMLASRVFFRGGGGIRPPLGTFVPPLGNWSSKKIIMLKLHQMQSWNTNNKKFPRGITRNLFQYLLQHAQIAISVSID